MSISIKKIPEILLLAAILLMSGLATASVQPKEAPVSGSEQAALAVPNLSEMIPRAVKLSAR